jgi:hypothetical protein
MLTSMGDDETSLFAPLFSDGRHLLTLGTLGLLLSGGFAIFLAAAGQFLPHDIQFLQMSAKDLCAHDGCRIVHFMIHDRVAFGATLMALSVLYFWLIHFPLRDRQAWAWWTLLLSNIAGFGSFLTFIAFGYLDTWHGLATLLLLPCFGAGLTLTYPKLQSPRHIRCLIEAAGRPYSTPTARFGYVVLLMMSVGVMAAGLTIALVGMTVVFVPEDLKYMHTTVAVLNELNPRLIPLIAHDRAGFGGGVFNVGFLMLCCLRCDRPSRHLWQALTMSGTLGFTAAIGIHPLVGYNNPVHLAPACLGAGAFFLGVYLIAPSKSGRSRSLIEPQATR